MKIRARRQHTAHLIVKIWSYLCVPPALLFGIIVALANRDRVRLSFDPFSADDPAIFFNLPLFLIIFSAALVGILIGGMAAWNGQSRWRSEARRARTLARTQKAETSVQEPSGSSKFTKPTALPPSP